MIISSSAETLQVTNKERESSLSLHSVYPEHSSNNTHSKEEFVWLYSAVEAILPMILYM